MSRSKATLYPAEIRPWVVGTKLDQRMLDSNNLDPTLNEFYIVQNEVNVFHAEYTDITLYVHNMR